MSDNVGEDFHFGDDCKIEVSALRQQTQELICAGRFSFGRHGVSAF
jgi:hypothetical protein